MNNKRTLFFVSALLVALSGTAAADDRIGFSLSIGVPAHAYVAPPPVYYPPPPVVYYERPVVYYDRPMVYYGPPAVTVFRGPPVWKVKHHRHWRHW